MSADDLGAIVDAAPDAIITSDDGGLIVSFNPASEQMFGYSAAEVIGQPLTILVPECFQDAHREGLARVAGGGEARVIGQTGVITMWNDAAEHILGYSEDEAVGQPLTMIVPDRFHDAHNAGILRMSRGEDPRIIGQTVEVFARTKDGTEIPVELSLATWTLGEDRYFSGILRDITIRKWAEEKIESANSELAEKNQQLKGLSAKLAKYLSRQVYDSIFEGRTEVRVESYRKMLTVFFSDIEGFTDLTDMMEAESLSELLNQYLSEMSAIANRFGGTIDKFIGDGIMIFFGDPESRGPVDDAVACARMALAMTRRVSTLCEEWSGRGVQRPLRIRVGINTGYCTVGNFGSEERMDYTIVGGQVNAAARLEASAAAGQILVSHQTWALIKEEIECRSVGELKVKGIVRPLLTYEVLGVKGITDETPEADEMNDTVSEESAGR